MKLIGHTPIIIESCDCDTGGHSGHIRHINKHFIPNSWKYRRRGGPKRFQATRFDFTLNGRRIPRWLGRWLAHRKVRNRYLVNYHPNYFEVSE